MPAVAVSRGPLQTGQCEVCGMWVAARRDARRKRIVCGRTCHQKLYRRAAESTATTCAQCGVKFQARQGARYCSSVCRQRAYRNRISARG